VQFLVQNYEFAIAVFYGEMAKFLGSTSFYILSDIPLIKILNLLLLRILQSKTQWNLLRNNQRTLAPRLHRRHNLRQTQKLPPKGMQQPIQTIRTNLPLQSVRRT